MNKNVLEGNWNIAQGKIKEHWGKLTDDDLIEINGKRDQLVGKIQKKYGLAKDAAEEQIKEWEKKLSESNESE